METEMTKKTNKTKKVYSCESPKQEEKSKYLLDYISEKEKQEAREKEVLFDAMKQIIGEREFVLTNSSSRD